MSLFGGHSTDHSAPASAFAASSSPAFPPEDAFSDFSIQEIRPPSPLDSRRHSFSSASHLDFQHAQTPHVAYQAQAAYDEHRDDDDADDHDHDEEEGREEGEDAAKIKARTWRHYTAADRDVHSSLLTLRAQDLSAHLYNAHALKARLRTPAASTHATPAARKLRWISKDETTGRRPWMPDAAWSAWPLKPESVPKADTFAGTWGSRVLPAKEKVSRDLEEDLGAVFLRQAKDNWMNRQPAVRPRSFPATPAKIATVTKSGRRSVSRGPSSGAETEQQHSDDAVGSDYVGSRRSSTVSQHAPPDSSLIHVRAPHSAQHSPSPMPASSPPVTRPGSPGSIKDEAHLKGDMDIHHSPPTRPVFSADDDRSHALLAPTVRHVMSKLDDLLLSLHRQREGQHRMYRRRGSGDSSDTSARSLSTSSTSRVPSRSAKSPSDSKTRQRASTPAVGRQRARTASNTPKNAKPKAVRDLDGDEEMQDADRPEQAEAAEETEEDEEDVYRDLSASPSDYSDGASKSSRKKSRTQAKDDASASPASLPSSGRTQKDPRDWSEVLGIAALTGWDSTVVARAAKRCESLFGENMLFRTFPEVGPVLDEHASDGQASDDEARDGVHAASGVAFPCPFPMCKRHIDSFDRGWRWRDHLKRTHKQSTEQIARHEDKLVFPSTYNSTNATAARNSKAGRFRQTVLDYNPMHWTPPSPLTCVHCGESSPIYTRVSRLLDHLKRTHKYDPRVQLAPRSLNNSMRNTPRSASTTPRPAFASDSEHPSSGAEADVEDTTEAGEQERMLGGVHLDGFLQPILLSEGRGKDKAPRLERAKAKRNKEERKAAREAVMASQSSTKRKRALMADEEERLARER